MPGHASKYPFGCAGGGGYGGAGGPGSGSTGGVGGATCGNRDRPLLMGSGGGSVSQSGGSGGGVIVLVSAVISILAKAGRVRAQASPEFSADASPATTETSGGGAGGSIYIEAAWLEFHGVAHADGGQVGFCLALHAGRRERRRRRRRRAHHVQPDGAAARRLRRAAHREVSRVGRSLRRAARSSLGVGRRGRHGVDHAGALPGRPGLRLLHHLRAREFQGGGRHVGMRGVQQRAAARVLHAGGVHAERLSVRLQPRLPRAELPDAVRRVRAADGRAEEHHHRAGAARRPRHRADARSGALWP